MKKIKSLCLIAALGVMVTGGSLLQSSPAYSASTYTVTSGTELAAAVSKAKSGDTILVSGEITSNTVAVPANVTIKGKDGKNKDKVIFSLTSGNNGRGFLIQTDGSTISDLDISGAADNGIYIEGSNNNLTNLDVHGNKDSGVQLSNGAANNTLSKIYSYSNADAKGENADGFSVKIHSGEGNKLSYCIAEGNSDDGYDLYAAHGVVTFDNCIAINNGDCNGVKGDGNGFKLGGVDNKTTGAKAHLDPLNHVLNNCISIGNTSAGFARNNQNGIVTMTNCLAQDNGAGNYKWCLTGTPSALVKDGIISATDKVTFGVAQIVSCKSLGAAASQKDDLSGAALSGNCIGFVNKAYSGK